MALRQPQSLTEAEYLALQAESDTKYEFVNGQVYAMAGGSEAHADIAGNIFFALRRFVPGTPCKAYTSDMCVRVEATRSFFFPDVSLVCGERRFMEDAPIDAQTNPTVLFEVLSPSTQRRDLTIKFRHYAQLPTLQDYVVVAQAEPFVECRSRSEGKAWLLTYAYGLEASIYIPSIDYTLALAEVYEGISFEAQPD